MSGGADRAAEEDFDDLDGQRNVPRHLITDTFLPKMSSISLLNLRSRLTQRPPFRLHLLPRQILLLTRRINLVGMTSRSS